MIHGPSGADSVPQKSLVPEKKEVHKETPQEISIGEVASKKIVKQMIEKFEGMGQHSGSSAPVGVQIKVQPDGLKPGGPSHGVAIERQHGQAAPLQGDKPARPSEFYDKILNGLTSKPDNRETIKKTIDVAFTTLHQMAAAGTGQGIALKLTDTDHVILYLTHGGKEKSIDYSGIAQPTVNDVSFIAAGSFGLVQKVGSPQTGEKILKTIRMDKGPEAKEDLQYSRRTLTALHAAHPDGKVPNLEPAGHMIRVPATDPATGEETMIDGILNFKADGDAFDIGPDANGDPPDRTFVLTGGSGVFGAQAFMHSQGYAHRDIKPGNILIKGNDFYLADVGGVRKPEEWTADSHQSGTTQYQLLSDSDKFEEQFNGGDLVGAQKTLEKMDVFATAAWLFEAVTGMTVYDGMYPADPSGYINHEGLDPDEAQTVEDAFDYLGGSYGPEFETFMRAALNIDPDMRPTAAEAQEMLKNMI